MSEQNLIDTNTTQVPLTWRDVLPIHPAAELFPLMDADELKELGEDIRARGLRAPIVLWTSPDPHDKREFLLDGRNRLDAVEQAGLLDFDDQGRLSLKTRDGLYPIRRQLVGHGDLYDNDPYRLVVSFNIRRRNLSADQKRELISKLLKADPTKSDRQIAEQVKASPTTVGKTRKAFESTGDVSTVDTRADTKGRQQQAHKSAKRPPKPDVEPSSGTGDASKGDIGPNSTSENGRLRSRITELENAKRLLELKVIALESALGERTAVLELEERFVRNPKDLAHLSRKLKSLLHPDRVFHPEAKTQLDAAFKALVDAINPPLKHAADRAKREEEMRRRRQEVREKNSRKSKEAWAKRKAARQSAEEMEAKSAALETAAT